MTSRINCTLSCHRLHNMSEFTKEEWKRINEFLDADPQRYGIPERVYGSAILASFNIRKLGKINKRSIETWEFITKICSHFDLISIQEIMDDLEGLDYIRAMLGSEYYAAVSDITGVFPGEKGLGERLGFIYNFATVKRGDIVSDISIDRSKLLRTILENYEPLLKSLSPYIDYLSAIEEWKAGKREKDKPKPPKVKLPIFLSFIRQPFLASFLISGHPGTQPYHFIAVNAHLYFGNSMNDRRQEFDALMNWILGRLRERSDTYSENFILLGDLNLDFDDPKQDREGIEKHILSFNETVKEDRIGANIYFPFLDKHPKEDREFRTNARLSETFDQIGFFSYDRRMPRVENHQLMGRSDRGPDYGVVNFVKLFQEALDYPPIEDMDKKQKKVFFSKFEHEVSDHLPLWVRLPLPDKSPVLN